MFFIYKTFLTKHMMWIRGTCITLKRQCILLYLTTTYKVFLTSCRFHYIYFIIDKLFKNLLSSIIKGLKKILKGNNLIWSLYHLKLLLTKILKIYNLKLDYYIFWFSFVYKKKNVYEHIKSLWVLNIN
jgi:hypothetical protein